MEALCFYYHDHELKNINKERYGLVDFYQLPEEPIIDKTFQRGNSTIKMFKLNRICGTCIAKNKTKSIVSLLTPNGVVNVKFRKDYFTLFDKQISGYKEDGKKCILEKSWFNRGNMIIVTGIRSDNDFIVKKYASTPGHELYHIDTIHEDGSIELRNIRAQGEVEDDE